MPRSPLSTSLSKLSGGPKKLLEGQLSVSDVVIIVGSSATPLTVVAGVVTTGYAVTGITGLPIAFVVIGAVLALFCVGYVAMARYTAYAGAFYTYITQGLGRPAGVGAAWIALASYNVLQAGLYGAIGPAATPLLSAWFGIDVPWWVVALAAWAIVAVLGLQRVKFNARVLAVLLLAEVAVIVLFSLTGLIHPAGGTVTFDTLNPAALVEPGVGATFALAVLGFIGFESTVVYSEEARRPAHRTVKIASFTAVVVITLLYTLSSWAMSVATGPAQIVAQSQAQSTELIFNLAGKHLGDLVIDISRVLFVTSVLAAMISFHNTTNRYIFALGRERVLPEVLGATRGKTGAPKWGSVIQSAFGFVVIVVFAVAGWDPLVHLFFWGGTTGALGVLLLIAATSIAIVSYFLRNPTQDTVWQRLIAPVFASCALLVVVVLAVANFDILLGVAPTSPLRSAIPIAFLVIAILGALWALFLRQRRPEVYTNIGRAVTSTSGSAAQGSRDLDADGQVPASADFDWKSGR